MSFSPNLFILFNLLAFTTSQVLKMNFTIETETQNQNNPNLESFLELPPLLTQWKTSDRTYVDLCLGTPPQCFSVLIQTNTFSLWVHDSTNKNITENQKFNRTKSSTLSVDLTQFGIGVYNHTVIGITGIDSLHIGNVIVNKTKFIIATKPSVFTNIDGMIGLGYNPSTLEEDYSIVHQLFFQKIIFHRVYSLRYFSNRTGELSFGQIPKEIVDNYKQYGRCDTLDKIVDSTPYKNKNWQCKLYSIIFGSKASDNSINFPNAKLTFMSYRKRALIPLDKFNMLIEKYFNRKLEDNSCQVSETSRRKKIECRDLNGLTDILLSFGDWGMKFEPSQLFTSMLEDGKYEFLIYYKVGYEKFILGRRLLSIFDMVYDNHNQQIGFYNTKNNVVLLSDIDPQPPKLHEDIQDKKPKPNEKNPAKPKPDNKPKKDKTEIEGDETGGEHNVVRTKRQISNAFIIQISLLVLISLIVIGLFGFLLYTYKQYRKKTKFNNQNYYIKQVHELTS